MSLTVVGHGITGPLAVFEGNKGFMETIAGPFQLDWSQDDLEQVSFRSWIGGQDVQVMGIMALPREDGWPSSVSLQSPVPLVE